jgi:hypothetical protein
MRADRLNRVKQAAFGPFVAIIKLKLDLANDPNYTPPSTFIKRFTYFHIPPFHVNNISMTGYDWCCCIICSLFAELTTSKSKMGQTGLLAFLL